MRWHPPMRVLTTEGEKWMENLPYGEASAVGQHWNAVRKALEGDDWPLLQMWGTTVGGHQLETDPLVIYVLGHQGEVNFDDLYGYGGQW